MSRPPRNNHRDHRGDRTGDGRENRAPPDRYPEDDRTTPSDRTSRERRPKESKCSHICSRRGIVLMCSVLTNALVLICVVAAQMVMSGVSAMGGFNINSNFNLQGTELQQVRELDMQFGQMRAPGIYGGLAFSLVFGVGSLVFTISGNRPAHRLPGKTLYATLVFAAVGAAAYVVAVGLYLHFVITVNGTDICQRRERLYARNGYTWMNCDVGGADAAVAMFGLITAILYAAATGLTFQTVRGVRRYRRDRERHRAGREAPPRADTTAV